ncbi:MAG: S1C family serine protease, partial [Oscillospiraceae bacterium]|nr:S1C family serine protease [Oscillospiraceae bacterium]
MYDDKNRGYPYGGGYGGSYNPYGAPESARPENSLREPRKAGSEVGPYSDYRHSAYNSAMQNQPFIQPEASGVAEPLYGVSSEPEKKAKKKGAARAGLTAAILALALIGGALGGGVTAWYLGEINEPVAAVSHNEIPAQAQETQSAAPVAPVVVAEGDVTGVVEKAAPSVVEITLKGYAQTFFGVQESEGAGSGVILTEDGYVVTNNHVVEGGEEFTVRDHEGNEYTAEL